MISSMADGSSRQFCRKMRPLGLNVTLSFVAGAVRCSSALCLYYISSRSGQVELNSMMSVRAQCPLANRDLGHMSVAAVRRPSALPNDNTADFRHH